MNKFCTWMLGAVLALAGASAMTSCLGDPSNKEPQWMEYIYSFENDDQFTAEGYWIRNYDTTLTQISVPPSMIMTHSASVMEYGGVEYKSWKGFCPTRSKDNADHPTDWTAYQWGSIAGGGSRGSIDYMLACWDTQESLIGMPKNPSVAMIFTSLTQPQQVDITNSAYAYWAMKNGSAFSRAFTDADWCKVVFYGVKDGQLTASVDAYLAKDGKIVDQWSVLDLTPLGTVSAIYMQMESSDSGQWGMNNPAYFCLDNFKARIAL